MANLQDLLSPLEETPAEQPVAQEPVPALTQNTVPVEGWSPGSVSTTAETVNTTVAREGWSTSSGSVIPETEGDRGSIGSSISDSPGILSGGEGDRARVSYSTGGGVIPETINTTVPVEGWSTSGGSNTIPEAENTSVPAEGNRGSIGSLVSDSPGILAETDSVSESAGGERAETKDETVPVGKFWYVFPYLLALALGLALGFAAYLILIFTP